MPTAQNHPPRRTAVPPLPLSRRFELTSLVGAVAIMVAVAVAAHLLGTPADGTPPGTPTVLRILGVVACVGLLALWAVLRRTVRRASERLERTAEENARIAALDGLTGVANRRTLVGRLEQAVDGVSRVRGGVSIVVLDLDRFKDVNDSLGHENGDELLVQVAARLDGAFTAPDLVARVGGDEFAVLLPGTGPTAAERQAHHVRDLFAEPFAVAGMSIHVHASVGVATVPQHADDAASLLRRADVAMYQAKRHRTGVAVYDPATDRSSPARLLLETDLHGALERPGELTMHYQPKIDLVGGRTVGLEALMRWHHPVRGEVEPSVFIPIAEQSGLIERLTAFALETVVSQLAAWPVAARLPVAVNLSAHSVTSDAVVATVERVLAEHGVDACWLQVEITETAVVADPARVIPVLQRLSDAGVRVAIDDFGIGSTSFAQLRDLPVDVLKIDRLFVEDLRPGVDRPGAQTVIRAMVDMAHCFGMQVVAEGVEDGTTAARLVALDVDQGQGYWFSPALAAEALTLSDVVA